jgi:hypothetical protein
MLLSFAAVNGEGHMSIVSQLFRIKIGGNVCLWHIAQACYTKDAWQMQPNVSASDPLEN